MSPLYAFAETYLIPAQLFLAMLGMGATLSVRDFLTVLRYPAGLAVGLALQLIFVPLVALAFIKGFDMSPGWAVGLLLVAAVPGGTVSNLFTFLGRGNVPLSISVTLASTILCMATIPLILNVFASGLLPVQIDLPNDRIIMDILRYLLLPLALGMLVYRFKHDLSSDVTKWSIRGSLFLVACITVAALGSGRMEIAAYGWGPPLTIAAFGVVMMLVPPQILRLLGRYDDDTTALAIEVALRNTAIGLLLVQFFFVGQPEQGHVLYTCLFYAGIGGLLCLPVLLLHRYKRSPVLLRKPKPRPEPDPVTPEV